MKNNDFWAKDGWFYNFKNYLGMRQPWNFFGEMESHKIFIRRKCPWRKSGLTFLQCGNSSGTHEFLLLIVGKVNYSRIGRANHQTEGWVTCYKILYRL